MGGFMDYVKAIQKNPEKADLKKKPNSKIRSRRYNIIARGPNLEDKVIPSVAATRVNNEKAILKLMGYSRFDTIEVVSFVELPDGSRDALHFGKPTANFNRTLVPNSPDEVKPDAAQMTFDWGSVSNIPNAVLSDGSKKLEIERSRARQKAQAKQAQKSVSKETRTDIGKVIIYRKKSNKQIFYGTQLEAVAFIRNRRLKIDELVLYIDNKTYSRIQEIENA